MRTHRPLRPRSVRAAALAAAVCAGLSSLTGCSDASAGGITGASAENGVSGTFYGTPTGIGAGSARAYVTLDADGRPTDVGIRMTAAALDGLPDAPMTEFPLAMPAQGASTIFDSVVVDWNAHGHNPAGLFDKPHFDMHFYMVDAATIAENDPLRLDYLPRAGNLPPAAQMPTNYSPPEGLPVLTNVPKMGQHWTNNADVLAPGGFDFTQTFIAGSWDGAYTFMEPMMTREWLLTRSSADEEISQPEIYPKPGRYPTTYSVNYDAGADEYVLELAGMQPRP